MTVIFRIEERHGRAAAEGDFSALPPVHHAVRAFGASVEPAFNVDRTNGLLQVKNLPPEQEPAIVEAIAGNVVGVVISASPKTAKGGPA